MLELQNFQKMKDLLAENFENFWKNVVLRKILGTFVFRKKLFRGALQWKGGPKFRNTPPPPQPETGWHGPANVLKNAR